MLPVARVVDLDARPRRVAARGLTNTGAGRRLWSGGRAWAGPGAAGVRVAGCACLLSRLARSVCTAGRRAALHLRHVVINIAEAIIT